MMRRTLRHTEDSDLELRLWMTFSSVEPQFIDLHTAEDIIADNPAKTENREVKNMYEF